MLEQGMNVSSLKHKKLQLDHQTSRVSSSPVSEIGTRKEILYGNLPWPSWDLLAKLVVTSALLVVTSATLVVTSALLLVTRSY